MIQEDFIVISKHEVYMRGKETKSTEVPVNSKDHSNLKTKQKQQINTME